MQKPSEKPQILRKISFGEFHNFCSRHIGPNEKDQSEMLKALDLKSLDELVAKTVPDAIRLRKSIQVEGVSDERAVLEKLRNLVGKNQVNRSLLGLGFSDCITPNVILRNVLENPGWYTQYTPYQAEIAQGRLEAILNFQTMTVDLTGLPVANASLLDEATACAEAMTMSHALHQDQQRKLFYVSMDLHPQNRAVIETRARPLGIEVRTFDQVTYSPDEEMFGVIFQYPNTDGLMDPDLENKIHLAKSKGLLVTVAADPLALTLVKSPGALGADIAVGSFQRFGVPMGFGGPSAAYLACRDEFKRSMPGRIVGLSKDMRGRPAIRLALQTREQHIRREKATSNICTSQVLLAVIASMYAVYHGADGLRQIASRTHGLAVLMGKGLKALGFQLRGECFFDTVTFSAGTEIDAKRWVLEFLKHGINIRHTGAWITIALDEVSTVDEVSRIIGIFSSGKLSLDTFLREGVYEQIPQSIKRDTPLLEHPVFHQYHSEHEMLRYMSMLEKKDLALNFSMIPLGSCTMKLNATVEMIPVTWPEIGKLHPAAPKAQVEGYLDLFKDLEAMLSEVTGFDAVSLQPNAGSQGEYAGLLAIRGYHESRGEAHRNICLIPKSAHGTNPASAVMAGFEVVVVECDRDGNVDLSDLTRLAEQHSSKLGALMVTYPSTHGVFESAIREICEVIHKHGGQVYMDGANMNAQIGLCRPGDFGPDVCHLNLHKTFCIPHGGGGPGMGPIGVKKQLAPFLPGHVFSALSGIKVGGSTGAVSSAPWGSASILPISWVYIKLMGSEGLKRATEVAILNANYMAKRLESHFPVLYKGFGGFVAHECILDLRPLKAETGIEVEDVAKRLMDYGFHAPTVSFPVAGTIMIEPTESESKAEMDRYIDALISIRAEIESIRSGKMDRRNNPLKNAPHTAEMVSSTEWIFGYTREQAAFPLPYLRHKKFWPSVARIDNVYGDRNLVCSCAPIENYQG
ncbi:MAG: aminomethyl-transferring glycine dehydrogenase [Bdellovibrionales bacterium]|nr:aminomethyl-transferring glycine dehydrogenase [Bdellovibrionales bacterium]